MFPPLLIIILLIFATPLMVVFDGPIMQGLVTVTAAVSVAIVALRIRPGEAGFLSSVIRPVAIVAGIPALWMVIQLMPLQNVGLAHPIWKSAAAAIGQPLAGSISIDPGATLISLAQYLSAVAIGLVAAAVAIDRLRAEWTLLALTIATALIALMALVDSIGNFAWLGSSSQAVYAATDSAGLGVILAAAAAFHATERANARPEPKSTFRAWPKLAISLAALAICGLCVIIVGTSVTYFAVACGVATTVATIMIRRFSLGPWGVAAVTSIMLFAAIAVITFQSSSRPVGLMVAFASQVPAPLINVTQRILAETNWAGTGAGTFAAVVPIYRNIDELGAGHIAPTAAAGITVEMGRAFFWLILAAVISIISMLLRGALRRQRDSSYATAGASCIVTITLLSFGNSALFSTSVAIIAAAAMGIAIAQSKSRLA